MCKSLFYKYFVILSVGVMAGCSNSAITPETENPEFPEQWARQGDAGTVDLNWLDDFADEKLDALVAEAVSNNFQLAQERARVYQAEQSVIVTRANKLPSLDVTLDGSRRQFEDASATAIASDSFNAAFRGRWDVDIWGRFSAAQKAAELRFAASLARMQLVERNVATATASAARHAIAMHGRQTAG